MSSETLRQRVTAAIAETPRLAILRDKLLNIGGEEIRVLPRNQDPDLDALILRGTLNTLPVKERKRGMWECRCHGNVAQLWFLKKLVAIETGYGLFNDDGLWRQHTWGIIGTRKPKILETLGTRDKYFGFRMTGLEADVFAVKVFMFEGDRDGSLIPDDIRETVGACFKAGIGTDSNPSAPPAD